MDSNASNTAHIANKAAADTALREPQLRAQLCAAWKHHRQQHGTRRCCCHMLALLLLLLICVSHRQALPPSSNPHTCCLCAVMTPPASSAQPVLPCLPGGQPVHSVTTRAVPVLRLQSAHDIPCEPVNHASMCVAPACQMKAVQCRDPTHLAYMAYTQACAAGSWCSLRPAPAALRVCQQQHTSTLSCIGCSCHAR